MTKSEIRAMGEVVGIKFDDWQIDALQAWFTEKDAEGARELMARQWDKWWNPSVDPSSPSV